MQFILDQVTKYLTPFTLSLYGACGETNYLLCSLLQKNFGFIDWKLHTESGIVKDYI
jgi:hypothetical protein